jgi:selenide,water dikinase
VGYTVGPFSAVEAITESILIDMLSGASDALEANGCSLSGGHTCEGAELALGFAVSSYVADASLLLRKCGGKVGDKIVLTKPLGTGSIFAASMRSKCKGPWVSEAIEIMTCSNGPPSQIAMNIVKVQKDTTNDVGIHACTDVTGFGLTGHLLEMLVSNDAVEGLERIGASLSMESIPFLALAVDATANNIYSTLYKDNFRSRRAIRNHEAAMESSPCKYPLLFDPQTAGGLLFFVSLEICHDFVHQLLQIP